MKNQMKVLVILLMIFLSEKSFAQLEVKKNPEKVVIGKSGDNELYYHIWEGDTNYVIMFRDQQYQQLIQIESFSFTNHMGELDGLYDAIKTVFLPENKKNKDYSLSITLNSQDIYIANFMSRGAYIRTKDGLLYLNEKQTDKLFGKAK